MYVVIDEAYQDGGDRQEGRLCCAERDDCLQEVVAGLADRHHVLRYIIQWVYRMVIAKGVRVYRRSVVLDTSWGRFRLESEGQWWVVGVGVWKEWGKGSRQEEGP
jgi:hypothetical protein